MKTLKLLSENVQDLTWTSCTQVKIGIVLQGVVILFSFSIFLIEISYANLNIFLKKKKKEKIKS